MISTLIYIVGFVAILKAVIGILNAIRIALTPINTEWAANYGLNSWAIVTGCTQGIGKGFCHVLANIRFNLVLISRNGSKLQKLDQELKSLYPKLETLIIVADFSQYSREMYDRIMTSLGERDVSMVVNNVGMAILNTFDNQSTEDVETQININVQAITHLTHRILPRLMKRENRSAIVNLSSNSILIPMKLLAVYEGTKAYDDVFSRGLSEDLRHTKIDVVSCRPCIVSTAATKDSKDFTACSAESCALGTLKALGRVDHTEGSFYHVVQTWMIHILGSHLTRMFGRAKLERIEKDIKK